jgi:hypothetical protein
MQKYKLFGLAPPIWVAQYIYSIDIQRIIKCESKRCQSQAVRTMSVAQGKLLLKLIARETDKTGYEIIKNYRGAFSATFWYGVGKIFGTDLKTEFHKDQDSIIETIVEKYKNDELY